MTTFSKELSRQRKQRKLSQSQVADYMSEHGFSMTQKGVSKWECGDTLPNAEQFLQLCRLYEIRDVLSSFLREDAQVAQLNELGRERLNEYMGFLLQNEAFRTIERRRFPLYSINVIKSAEDFSDFEKSEELDEDAAVPEKADFAVRLCDKSMAPLFEQGEVLFIHKKAALESGEFGLFFYHGEALCRLYMPGSHTELISANVSYPPICIENEKALSIVGCILNM